MEPSPFTLLTTAPTGTGKTLIAHHFIHSLLTSNPNSRCIYCTPLKALSNQKYKEACEVFKEENVGLITGDTKINPSASILICTTEVVRNMWYSSSHRSLPPCGLVLDEFHYISTPGRGTAVEEALTLAPPSTSFLLLSATIDDDRILGWLKKIKYGAVKVEGKKRVVGLEWMYWSGTKSSNVYVDSDGGPGGLKEFDDYVKPSRTISKDGGGFGAKKSHRMSPNTINPQLMSVRNKKPQRPPLGMMVDRLNAEGMFPAIHFVFSRKGCEEMCGMAVNWLMRDKGGRRRDGEGREFRGGRVSRGVEEEVYYYMSEEGGTRKDPNSTPQTQQTPSPSNSLLTADEIAIVNQHISSYNSQNPRPLTSSQINLLTLGVNVHHAGLLQPYRVLLETLFSLKLIKILYATTTLSAGINMPCKSVLVSSLTKRGDEGYEDVSRDLLLQMAGRAGRRGIDSKGYVVVVGNRFDRFEKLVSILKTKDDRCESCFEVKYGLVLCGVGRRRMREVVESSYYSYCKELEATGLKNGDDADEDEDAQSKNVVSSIESLLDNARKADFIRTCIAEEGVEVPDCIQLGKDLKHFKGIVSRIKAEEATLAYLTEQESTGEDYVNIEMSNKRLRDLQLDKDDTKVNQLATQIKIISALSVEQEQLELDDVAEYLTCYYDAEIRNQPPPLTPSRSKSRGKRSKSPPVNIPWSNFQALLRVLERHNCVVSFIKTTETEQEKVYTVTAKGDMVKKVNWDNSLLVTNLLGLTWDTTNPMGEAVANEMRDVLDEMTPCEIGCYASCLIAEENYVQYDHLFGNVETAVKTAENICDKLLTAQQEEGVDSRENPVNLNTDYVQLTKMWLEGDDWDDVVSAYGRQEGDVARILVRVADVLRQFGDVTGLDNCREARELIMRDVLVEIFK
ncbi:hypothetical protein TrVE_jg11083 [Triparma verrucosa]|uniref:Uncharacterized protein n=1 Tax=Triparma verrucosa TaxID=1606542 RepID=A0A9W7F4L3_9STRA|nr:hypothetical protein TrVE_jg11083 [Triparma verrucosa]